jgi:hypothetical protein
MSPQHDAYEVLTETTALEDMLRPFGDIIVLAQVHERAHRSGLDAYPGVELLTCQLDRIDQHESREHNARLLPKVLLKNIAWMSPRSLCDQTTHQFDTQVSA